MIATTHMLSHTIMPRAIALFHASHPSVRVELHAMGVEMAERITRREFELGLGYSLADPRVIDLEPIGSKRIVCVMRREHRLAARAVITPSDLCGEPQIGQSAPSQMGAVIDACFEEARVPITTVVRTNSQIAVWFMVNEGMGVALTFPNINADAFPDVVTRPFAPSLDLEINLFFARGYPRSRMNKAFAASVRAAAAGSRA